MVAPNPEQRLRFESDQQLNLVSVINNPDSHIDLAALLVALYDRISLSQLLQYFYSKATGETFKTPSTLLDNETMGLIQKSLHMVTANPTRKSPAEHEQMIESPEHLFQILDKELISEFYEERFELNSKVFEHIMSPNFEKKVRGI